MREDKKITYSADVGEVFGIIDITHDKRVGYIAKLIVCLGFMQVLPIKRVCLAILKKKKFLYIISHKKRAQGETHYTWDQ